MSDWGKLDLGDWIGVVAGGVTAGVTGAYAYMSGAKKELETKMALLDGRMDCYDEGQAHHATKIAVVVNCQENTAATLADLKEQSLETNRKLDQVILSLSHRGH